MADAECFDLSDIEEAKKRARDIRRSAMDCLARREHSRVELARKLHQKFSDYEQVEIELDKLIDDQLLSDERFTEAYVSYRRRAGFGPIRITGELRERGVTEQLSSRYVNINANIWLELAEQARVKKFGAELPLSSQEKQRQQRFLLYRGFNHSHFKLS